MKRLLLAPLLSFLFLAEGASVFPALAEKIDSGELPSGWDAVKALAEKYEIEMPSFSIFGPSQCSAAYKIYSDAVYKDKNINSHQDYLDRVESDPLFGRVKSYGYRNCHVNGHKDWEFLYL